MPSRWAIADYWWSQPDAEWKKFAPHHVDPGEPHCFACGYWEERWDRPRRSEDRWNRARLDRAHIVPHALGGTADASNLLLLCSECHAASPDWPERSAMAGWIAKRPARDEELIEAWAKAYADVPEYLALFDAGVDEQAVAAMVRAGLSKAGMHRFEFSHGTRVAVLREVATRFAGIRRDAA